jgi:hypothetical protein
MSLQLNIPGHFLRMLCGGAFASVSGTVGNWHRDLADT